MVIRRASMSFQDCAAGRPVSLLKGQQVPLVISATDLDEQDAPWNVTISYRGEVTGWQKTLVKPDKARALYVHANAAGDYAILRVSGKHCPGDVLSPDTCRVVEQPMPSAQIEWNRIHECSGDTGVSALMQLHGTPPFTIIYTSNGHEQSRTLQSARAEISLQPERDGRYRYQVVRMSDANYKDVKLVDPGVELVVHRLAAARFAKAGQASVVSCEGSTVQLDVKLEVCAVAFDDDRADSGCRAQARGILRCKFLAHAALRS